MRKLIATLEINNWSFSIGGEHWFGSICFYDTNDDYQKKQVLHPISTKEAIYLNKKNKTRSVSLFKRGDLLESFMTKAETIQYAIKTFKEQCPHCLVLNMGSFCIADPQEVLIGPSWFKSQTNKLVAMERAAGGYERSPELSEKIFAQYCALVAKLDKTSSSL